MNNKLLVFGVGGAILAIYLYLIVSKLPHPLLFYAIGFLTKSTVRIGKHPIIEWNKDVKVVENAQQTPLPNVILIIADDLGKNMTLLFYHFSIQLYRGE